MRKIKFRVWHKPTKKYVTMSQEDWSYGKGKVKYKDSGDFLAISHDGFLCHEGYGNGADNVEDTENYVVQQYTGLKDKNGVEIYEGDIITYTDAYSKILHTVSFANGKFIAKNRIRPKEAAWLSDNGTTYDLCFIISLNPYEIIPQFSNQLNSAEE